MGWGNRFGERQDGWSSQAAPPPVGLQISDSFNRADGSIGVTDTGQEWSVLSGGASIVGKKVSFTLNVAENICVVESTKKDVEIRATVEATTGNSVRVYARVEDVNNCIFFTTRPNDGYSFLVRKVDGVSTNIGSVTKPITKYPFEMKLVVNGDTAKAYINDVEYMNSNIGHPMVGTKHGIGANFTQINGFSKFSVSGV